MADHLFPSLALTVGLALAGGATLVGTARALDLPSGAEQTGLIREAFTSHNLPIGPYAMGAVPTLTVEGSLEQSAFRIEGADLTTLQLLAPLRAQLAGAGFQTLLDCAAQACGGFDFRFGIRVLPEPDMHVDLGDFRFLSARRSRPEGMEHVSLLVSRSGAAGYVQITQVVPKGLAPDAAPATRAPGTLAPAATTPPADAAPTALGTALQLDGHVVLEDLVFAPGASALSGDDFPSLAALADWLRANPLAKVTLVGHTDASGGLDSNIALSRDRARAVRDVLVSRLAIPPDQISAEGVGYLAPRASNQTEDGQRKNRRVEAIVTSTP